MTQSELHELVLENARMIRANAEILAKNAEILLLQAQQIYGTPRRHVRLKIVDWWKDPAKLNEIMGPAEPKSAVQIIAEVSGNENIHNNLN